MKKQSQDPHSQRILRNVRSRGRWWKNIDLDRCCDCKVMISKQITSARWTKDGHSPLQTCCGRHMCADCKVKGIQKQNRAKARFADFAKEIQRAGPSDTLLAAKGMILEQEKGLMCPACYQPGFYLEDNDQMQLQRTERLAKDNHPTALHTLGTLYVLGHGGVTRDTAKGERYLHEAFNAGSEAAGQFIAFKHAGQVHSEDEVDNIQAKTWYEKLPRSAPAQHGLAELYLGEIRGIQGYQGISMDRNKAMELLRKSSEQLYPPALKRYSCMLFEDHCFEEALKWSLKGASDERSPFNTSYVACQGLTAVLYNQEYSNFRLARFWAQRALDNGDAIGVPCNQQIALREVLESIDQSIWKMCGCCKKESPQVRCGSCLAAAYCDQACQRKDWKQHKKVCKDVPKILTKEDAGLID